LHALDDIVNVTRDVEMLLLLTAVSTDENDNKSTMAGMANVLWGPM